MATTAGAQAYAACVPHVPFMEIQPRAMNAPFWAAYEAQAARLRAFDPELVIVFGADHYEGQLMRAMPPFMIGFAAESVPDRGGFPGQLRVPEPVARACAERLIDEGFDITVSSAMQLDHGFSQVLHHMLGGIDARPVIPVFVNALAHPRPRFARVRQLGMAVGRFAATLGQRVAFLGSGGLSHDTSDIFPQVHEKIDAAVREFFVHGGERGAISRQQWRSQLHAGLEIVNQLHVDRTPGVGQVRPEWDEQFLRLLCAGDYSVFDAWGDAEVVRSGGNGAGEVRAWIAAMAAAQQLGAGAPIIDYYEAGTSLGVAAVVAHAGGLDAAP
jgi:2,3-dihydroxyphenylpropionate 1,2-dioxygenase